MPTERRSRFANPVVVLADLDVQARYGPWIESLLVCLIDEGLNPMLVSPPRTTLGQAIPERAMTRLNCPPAGWQWLRRRGSRRLVEQLSGEPVRMVLATSGGLARYGNWLADRLNVPLAVLVMGGDEVGQAAAAERLACAMAGSKALAEQLIARLAPERAIKVHQVGLGVHLGRRSAAFEEAGRACGLLAAGPLGRQGNLDQFIEAAARLAKGDCDAVFFIVASGREERRLRRLAAERNLTSRLTFVSDLRGLGDIYEGIDVFIQPFVSRRLDLRLLEAMAAGVVVLARNGGALDLVRDGVNGVELTRGDEIELAMLLERLLAEPAAGRRIGASARRFIQENHLAGVTVQKAVELLKPIALSQQTLTLVK